MRVRWALIKCGILACVLSHCALFPWGSAERLKRAVSAQAAAGEPGRCMAACVACARVAADVRVLPVAREGWPPPQQQHPSGPHPGMAVRLGFDIDALATSVCPASALAAADAASACAARLRSATRAMPEHVVAQPGGAASKLARQELRTLQGIAPALSPSGGSAAGAAAGESAAAEAGADAPARCEVQWEAALQLGGASRLLVLPAGEAPALQFLLASADAHAASAECGQAGVHGRGALSALPLRCAGLSLQVRGARTGCVLYRLCTAGHAQVICRKVCFGLDYWCFLMLLLQDRIQRCLRAQGAEAQLLDAQAPAQPLAAGRSSGAVASGQGARARVRVAAATRLDASIGPADAGSAAACDTEAPLLLRGEDNLHS